MPVTSPAEIIPPPNYPVSRNMSPSWDAVNRVMQGKRHRWVKIKPLPGHSLQPYRTGDLKKEIAPPMAPLRISGSKGRANQSSPNYLGESQGIVGIHDGLNVDVPKPHWESRNMMNKIHGRVPEHSYANAQNWNSWNRRMRPQQPSRPLTSYSQRALGPTAGVHEEAITSFHQPFGLDHEQEKGGRFWNSLARDHPMFGQDIGEKRRRMDQRPMKMTRRMVQTSKRSVEYVVCPKWSPVTKWKGVNTRKQSLTFQQSNTIVESSETDQVPQKSVPRVGRCRKFAPPPHPNRDNVMWIKPYGGVSSSSHTKKRWLEETTPETNRPYRIYRDVELM
uniref:Uncharacterized protein n=1 Tax=Lotharella globosa TaxID=91324 RepID=A0A7S3Z3R1_9EUKA|mmetsp:Transcript_12548/g.25560  ORF Transcript_12548/g.25560 Transcript_12548/m.25560 type:complete len:334 (-) Transcript_12548:524-1525(-)|eukprot:CAMPEP_0167788282 /NCGR_PEP_ID=MMETSP0111_2-20121227/9947_1 /TAXON_ID=91324 /ORGANISM="Lotharella globosa, Strain CCCM811" /LENGTH=333 /DNA_ID=CAMNT_0007680129 /DNA_START=29 /DNA_END=1030 /DNA_ORIENTATION=-